MWTVWYCGPSLIEGENPTGRIVSAIGAPILPATPGHREESLDLIDFQHRALDRFGEAAWSTFVTTALSRSLDQLLMLMISRHG